MERYTCFINVISGKPHQDILAFYPVFKGVVGLFDILQVLSRHRCDVKIVNRDTETHIIVISGSSGSIQTMSLSRRAVQEGQNCLIVDDFLKGGGTAKGMEDLMREFNVGVVGKAFVMETASPVHKRISDEKSLMVLDISHLDDDTEAACVTPAPWLKK